MIQMQNITAMFISAILRMGWSQEEELLQAHRNNAKDFSLNIQHETPNLKAIPHAAPSGDPPLPFFNLLQT